MDANDAAGRLDSDQTLSRRTRELAILVEASTAFSSTHSLDALLQTMCHTMTESVESTFCRVYLLEEDGQRLTLRAACALRDAPGAPGTVRTYPLSVLPWHSQALARGEPLVLVRSQDEAKIPEPERTLLFHPQYCSVLLMPLSLQDRRLGVAVLGEIRAWERTRFTSEKVELCRAISRQGALALENILALESSSKQGREIKLVIDNVADGIFRTDPDLHLLTFNPAAERITGYSANQVLGRSCCEIMQGLSEDGTPLCARGCPLHRLANSPRVAGPITVKEWITRHDGTKVLVAHSVMPILDPNDRLLGAVSVIRDITREEELVRLKSEFISMVSHELRTPLANISASAELLAKLELDTAAEKDMLHILNQECSRLMRLVDQVLEASRLEKGQIQPTVEPLALVPLIEQMVNLYRSRYRAFHFDIQAGPPLPVALGDLVLVEIVLENLIQNTVNYSPEGSTITVSAQEREGMVHVCVADQGIGIPADQLDSIFQRFHRLSNPQSKKVSGFGLGLYIARLLVEAQGGVIWAESQPGQGSRFCFTLRAANPVEEQQAAA